MLQTLIETQPHCPSVLETLLCFHHPCRRDKVCYWCPVKLGRLWLSKRDWKFTEVTATCFCCFTAFTCHRQTALPLLPCYLLPLRFPLRTFHHNPSTTLHIPSHQTTLIKMWVPFRNSCREGLRETWQQ